MNSWFLRNACRLHQWLLLHNKLLPNSVTSNNNHLFSLCFRRLVTGLSSAWLILAGTLSGISNWVQDQLRLTDFWQGYFVFPLWSLLFSRTCAHGDGDRGPTEWVKVCKASWGPGVELAQSCVCIHQLTKANHKARLDLRDAKINFIS